MADQYADLRSVFKGLVVDYSPPAEQIAEARSRLHKEIAGERSTRRPQRLWRVPVAAVAAVVVAFVVITSILPWGRAPADAYLLEIAQATRVLPATELPDGAYLYTESGGLVLGGSTVPEGYEFEDVVYLISLQTESWIQGGFQLLRTTLDDPVFFDEKAERVFYEAGLAEIAGFGESVETAHDGFAPPADPAQWSADVDTLRSQLEAEAELAQNGLPLEQRILDVAFDLLLPESQASPTQRATVIEAVASLDVETAKLVDGNVTVSVSYRDEYYGSVVEIWTLDEAGYLVGTTLVTLDGSSDGAIPAGTAFTDITWSVPAIVAEAGLIP